VVECKKSEKFAWVFFTRPFKFEPFEIDGQYLDSLQCLTKKSENSLLDVFLFDNCLHYSHFSRVAVAYSEFMLNPTGVEKNEKHKREIFETQNQLKKYLNSQYEQFMKYNLRLDHTPFYLYFPCVVLDGLFTKQ
jgi:hypothetical protein